MAPPLEIRIGVNPWAALARLGLATRRLQHTLKLVRRHREAAIPLRPAGIRFAAIHNHRTRETPRFVFLHYWGKGQAAARARAQ
jgi:hypothetical protein